MTKSNQYIEAPLSAPSKSAIRKEVKRTRELNINNMTTGQISWHLACRHRLGLVTLYGLAMTSLVIVKW